jgi:hypothetical protein
LSKSNKISLGKKKNTAHQAFIKQGTTYVNLGVQLRIFFFKLFNGFEGGGEEDKNNFTCNHFLQIH